MKQEALFLFVTSAVLLIFILVLLFAFCCHCLSYRTKHILVTLILVLEFAIAVVLLLRYANNENLQDTAIPWYQQFGWNMHSWRCTLIFIQPISMTSTSTTNWSWLIGSPPSHSAYCSSLSSAPPSAIPPLTKFCTPLSSRSLPPTVTSTFDPIFYSFISSFSCFI